MFTLNEEPCQFAICAGQIKTVPGGAWPWHFGRQLHDFIITLSTYHFLRKSNKMFVFFIVSEVQKTPVHYKTQKHFTTYTGRCLSQANPCAGCDCLGDSGRKKTSLPLVVFFEQGTEPPNDNSFVRHMECFIVSES